MEVMDRGLVVIRRRLGSALKQLRTAKGMHLDRVARDLEMSPAKLSRLETGQVTPKVRDVRDLLVQYEAPAELSDELLALTNQAKDQGWWQPFSAQVPGDLGLYISLEAEARAIKIFAYCIPTLLETRDYASMILRGLAPQRSEEQHSELLNIRMRRQDVLYRGPGRVAPLHLHVILDQGALHRAQLAEGVDEDQPPEDTKKHEAEVRQIMRDQLIDLGRRAQQENVHVQVFPYRAGFSQAQSLFTIFEPREPGDEPVVCVESTGRDAYYEGRTELAKYEVIWAELEAKALNEHESRTMIEQAAAQWKQGPEPS